MTKTRKLIENTPLLKASGRQSETMQIKALEIRNYRLFRDAKLTNLPRLMVLVGANGSGKSMLFDVFSFLKEALAQNVAVAVTRRGGQVFVSTHSPEFLNAVKLEEIYWLVKERGVSTVRRASDSELLRNLVAEGDLPGALWKQGLFEGAGPR